VLELFFLAGDHEIRRSSAVIRKPRTKLSLNDCASGLIKALVVQKTLDVALDPKSEGKREVDFTDRLAMLSILGNNRWARDMIWPYVRDNWDALIKKYDTGYKPTSTQSSLQHVL
jgi:hypothetical protein